MLPRARRRKETRRPNHHSVWGLTRNGRTTRVGRTLVPPTKIPPRAPFGPSLVLAAGTPFEGMDFVLQKSAAVRSET